MPDSPFGPLLDTRLRLVTWNLWWRYGPWEARLPAIIETLRRLEPDVVCLQEVWLDASTGDGATGDSCAARIAAALGYEHVVVASRLDLDGLGFGNAVVSRWPIEYDTSLALPSPPDLDEYRVVLRADIGGPRGPVQVYTTHLHWRFDHSHIRQEQVRAVCGFIHDASDRTYPAVLCGDFNAEPGSDEIRMLTGMASVPAPPLVFHDAWRLGGRGEPGLTWSNDNPYAALDLEPARRIDYVFTGFPKAGGAGNCVHAELVGTEPIDGVVPSDHYGVLADLRY
jgi:endonuclease/exonuclease/phosphatase family metal-dependent hydrolase